MLDDPYEIMKVFIMEKTANDKSPVCVNYAANYSFTLKNLLTFLARKKRNKKIRDACMYCNCFKSNLSVYIFLNEYNCNIMLKHSVVILRNKYALL